MGSISGHVNEVIANDDNSDEQQDVLNANITPNNGNINSTNKVVNLLRNDIIDTTFANKFLGQNTSVLSEAIAKQPYVSPVANNPLMALNEWCFQNFTRKPEFECRSTGPSHCPTHTVTCKMVYKAHELVTSGSDAKAKEAKNLAAIAMLAELERVAKQSAFKSNDDRVVNKAMVNQTNTEQMTSAADDNSGENISSNAITGDEMRANSDNIIMNCDANKSDNVSSNTVITDDISAECVENSSKFHIKLIDIDVNDDKQNESKISRQDSDTVSVDSNSEMWSIQNPMNYLLEWCQKIHILMPQFVDIETSGNGHCPSFTITCKLMYENREYVTKGSGRSLKDAKKYSVIEMINELKIGPQIKQTSDSLPQSKLLPVADNIKPNAELCLIADHCDIPSELIQNNPKGYINELCSKRGYKSSYEDVTRSGGGLCSGFAYECVIVAKADRIIGRGFSNARKIDAQQNAAKDAIVKYFELRAAQNSNSIPAEEIRRHDNTRGITFFKKFSANDEMETVLRNIQSDEYNMQTLEKILAKIGCIYEVAIDSDQNIVGLSIIWSENGANVLNSYGEINGSLERAKDIAAKKMILCLSILKFSS